MKGDAAHLRRAHAAFARRLAHRPFLGTERPQDRRFGPRRRQPMAVMRPRQRARLRRVSRHAHVALVGLQAPAVQGVLLHRGDDEAPVRRPGDVEMRALPIEDLGRPLHVREPERGAVVMRQGEPVALRREGEPAHGRGRREGLFAALFVARRDALADRKGEAAARVQGERVDPAFCLGEGFRRAVRSCRGDTAIIAAGDDARPVARRQQHRAAGVRRHAPAGAVRDEEHVAIGERQRGRVPEPGRRCDMRAGVVGRDVLREGRGGVHAGSS